jgi:aspartate/tyrosine/aromatic aminotransferase
MFQSLTPAPPDAILGLTVAYNQDPNPKKINLGVGVFKDANGVTPILESVHMAEERLLLTERSKSYLPIDGGPAYQSATQKLLFGADHDVVRGGQAVTAQTPGGTGALRVAADFIAKTMPGATVWVSDPTWPNHPGVFKSAGLDIKTYPYFDASANSLDFDAMAAAMAHIPAGDVLVLHGCCHNPTGVDLTTQQWEVVAQLVSDLGILPLVDFAYQGFANGLREDAAGWLQLARPGKEMIVASSYSKNFGLYNERVGAMTLVGATPENAQTALSHVKIVVRTNYSNPPSHGGAIVSTVLNDDALREQWELEVKEMRDRVNNMRGLFVETLNQKGVDRDFGYIARQRGMFSFSGLNPEQVKRLRDEYAIYIVGSGRINVAGMTESNMDYLCDAIASVL